MPNSRRDGVARTAVPGALALSSAVPDVVIPASTWDELAAAYHASGDPAQAYTMARQAGVARDHAMKQEARSRAIALATQLEADRVQVQRDQLHEQAALAADRASLLQATHATLEQLGLMGQEITAQLEVDIVFGHIHTHLRALMDASHLSIWLIDANAHTLRLRIGIEDGQRLAPARVSLTSVSSHLARALREDREVEHIGPALADDPQHLPGTLCMQTALFGPLRVRGRVMGVMSIQSRQLDAYGERERLVFRTLCAYGAVALDNAAAFSDLGLVRDELLLARHAEAQLRQQADQATQAKNEFLAQISDALRRPLGALHTSLLQLSQAAATPGTAQQHDLSIALTQSRHVSALARDMLELARLESGAVHVVAEPFSLADLTQDVVLKFAPLAAQQGNSLSSDCAPNLPDVMADIGMIERVLSICIEVALCEWPAPQHIGVQVVPEGEGVRVAIVGQQARPQAIHPTPSPTSMGLGMAIARQMLLLHSSAVESAMNGSHGGHGRLAFSLRKAAV
jgi:K+-sensing histidine kinase KdpD